MRRLVHECLLAGEDNWSGDEDFLFQLSWLRATLAPALWRQWIIARCDGARRAYYGLTAAGEAALRSSHDALTNVQRPAPKAEANARYWKTFLAEPRLAWNNEDAAREIGELPLPVSLPTIKELHDCRNSRAESRKARTGKDAAQ